MGAIRDTVEINHPNAKGPRTVRLSRNIKRVIELVVWERVKLEDALQTVGITRSAYYVASFKPEFAAYMGEASRVFRANAALRSVARVDVLADQAVSEHVQLQANELLMGIEGITKVQRSENLHVHQVHIPGLTVIRGNWEPHGEDALLIGDQRAESENAMQINRIGSPVPHPSMKNARITHAAGDVIEPQDERQTSVKKSVGVGEK